MDNFAFDMPAGRVVFGAGTLSRIGDELERTGRRALILSTPALSHLEGALQSYLGDRNAGVFYGSAMHVPRRVADTAIEHARQLSVDACIALGGGSTIGLAKAIALELELPIIAIPTTYSGSEMTPIWGITDRGIKTTGRDPRALPRTVIYDPELTLSLPPPLAAVSGLNAIAHCVEALYAADGNPVTSLMAEEGIRALADGLPQILHSPGDIYARSRALYGAWLAGACLGTVSMALHHKLCHTLGGSFDMPHAETHAVLLPHVMAYNGPAAPCAAERVARALGTEDAAQGLWQLARGLGTPITLAELGFHERDVEKAAEIATSKPYPNPRPIERSEIAALLSRAVAGLNPSSHHWAAKG